MRLRHLLEAGGESPGKKEVAKTSSKEARKYFTKKMKKVNIDLEKAIPNFIKNYKLIRSKLDVHGTEARKDMPVVSYKQVKEFQKHLTDGFLDIREPFNTELEKLIGKFPKNLNKEEKKLWRAAGLKDGEHKDDMIDAQITEVSAHDLKPVQEQIYLSKVVENYKKKGIPSNGHLITTKTLIIDRNNMIIDGHHRWTTVMIADPSIKMKVLKVDLDMTLLLQVSKTFGVSMGNKQNS